MKKFKNCVCGILILFFTVTFCSGDKLLLNATCYDSRDCYITDGLSLNCNFEKQRCRCSNEYGRNFRLKWENDQCLMSKYGPCGGKGSGLLVGCSDGFTCVDNQCRDSSDTSLKTVRATPFVFEGSDCAHCVFTNDLRLQCRRSDNQCTCAKEYIADGRGTLWDIRNYDGNKNCSVGQFGPCGTNYGIKIDCHGDGISCVRGTCLDANHPLSEVGERCDSERNCKIGLLCSIGNVCIEPNSLTEGNHCYKDDECRRGLKCGLRPGESYDEIFWARTLCLETAI